MGAAFFKKIYLIFFLIILYQLFKFFTFGKFIPTAFFFFLIDLKIRYVSNFLFCFLEKKYSYSSSFFYLNLNLDLNSFYFFNDVTTSYNTQFIKNKILLNKETQTDNSFIRCNKLIFVDTICDDPLYDYFFYMLKWGCGVPFFFWFFEDQRDEFDKFENWADMVLGLGPNVLQ